LEDIASFEQQEVCLFDWRLGCFADNIPEDFFEFIKLDIAHFELDYLKWLEFEEEQH
jgi:hypothetical protein